MIKRHPNDVTVENPYSLEAIKFYAVQRAIGKHHGDYTAAAKELDINRATIYDILNRRGKKTTKPRRSIVLLAQAACLCLMVLTGCITKNVVNPVAIPRQPIDIPPTPRLATDFQRASTLSFLRTELVAPVTNLPSVTLAFNPSPDVDVSGYRIHYGTSSGNYTNSINVGTSLTNKLTLPAGVRYYFAALAYTPSGAESDFSNEVNYYIPKGNRVENLVLEIYETLGGPKVSETVLHSYTNSIPGVSQKYLRLRQDLLRIE